MAAPATFVCLHGAGGHASYWDLVADELRGHGHEVVAVTLPSDQEVGLQAYVDATLDVIGHRRDNVVLVAQSLAGFIAPLVAAVTPVDLMVLVAAMIPAPGETGGEWWDVLDHAGAVAAQGLPDDSPETVFVHDVPADVLARFPEPRDQAGTLFAEPWPLERWPDVDTRFLACADDRFFPLDWLTPIVRDRLGIEPDVVPGGHTAFLSRPVELAAAIDGCWRGHARQG